MWDSASDELIRSSLGLWSPTLETDLTPARGGPEGTSAAGWVQWIFHEMYAASKAKWPTRWNPDCWTQRCLKERKKKALEINILTMWRAENLELATTWRLCKINYTCSTAHRTPPYGTEGCVLAANAVVKSQSDPTKKHCFCGSALRIPQSAILKAEAKVLREQTNN